VEADEPTGFERGVRGLAIRIAKAVNRMLARRGPVWGDRYHARMLRTPREVRNALVYVLNNFRKHTGPGASTHAHRRDGSTDGAAGSWKSRTVCR
jgi:hypothetical protein